MNVIYDALCVRYDIEAMDSMGRVVERINGVQKTIALGGDVVDLS